MADNYSFRSALNGFNRNDVIEYINSILNSNTADSDEVAELEEKLRAAEEKIASLTEELKKEREAKEEKKSESEIEKIYEARLGAAMLDAKRFSEILVQEANDKASGLFADAVESADDTLLKADDIIKNIGEIKDNMTAALNELLKNMSAVSSSLSSFSSDVKSTGGMFNFSSDFIPVDEAQQKFAGEKKEEDIPEAEEVKEEEIPAEEVKKPEEKKTPAFDDFEIKVDFDD